MQCTIISIFGVIEFVLKLVVDKQPPSDVSINLDVRSERR